VPMFENTVPSQYSRKFGSSSTAGIGTLTPPSHGPTP
jgi:hypothetical protein